ncbi:MAG: nicotinate-nucleotide adenylyltransferase [Tyzzerella sp.]|nr:nicotinate-nucleotide adenylyltransferase [Tyzzerella sp.]
MKIGIMGGTFDPIHSGHLMLGRFARDLFALDEIWFMPNGTPPHKSSDMIESQTTHRVEMVKRAISNEKDFVLQLYEVDNKEVNYSYLTMEHFKEIYPEHEFYFIIGADSLFSIDRWKCPDRLLKTCIILAAYRDGKNKKEMEEKIAYLNQKFEADIRLLNTPNVDISSSEIREKLKAHEKITNMMPISVYEYILENQLYGVE